MMPFFGPCFFRWFSDAVDKASASLSATGNDGLLQRNFNFGQGAFYLCLPR